MSPESERTWGGSLLRLLFRLVVRTHPGWIQRGYGDDMLDAFDQRLRSCDGWRARLKFGLRASVDALRSGLRERRLRGAGGWRNQGPGDRGPRSNGPGGEGRAGRTDWGGGMMGWSEFLQDLKIAARSLRRAPGFTVAVVLVLALGVGANGAVFSAVRGTLLAPPPFPDADRIVLLDMADSSLVEAAPPRSTPWSYPKFKTMTELSGRPDVRISGFATRTLALSSGDGEPRLLGVEVVTPGYFEVLGAIPAAGRTFVESDDLEDAGDVVILSYSLWRDRFGGDGGVVGRSVDLGAQPATVVGIAPAGFRGLTGSAQAWVTVSTAGRLISPVMVRAAQAHWMRGVGRLGPDATLAQVNAWVRVAAAAAEEAYPYQGSPNTVRVGKATSLVEARLNPEARRSLVILSIAAALLLLVACANLAGLLLARSEARARESGVRLALGSGRWRVARSFLAESVLLSLLGGLAAVGVAYLGARAVGAAWPERFVFGSWNVRFMTREAITADWGVLAYTLGVSLAVAVVMGIGPAWAQGARGLVSSQGTGVVGSGRQRLRRALVGGEVALALILVVGAGLLIRSLERLQSVERGFAAEQLLTLQISVPRGSSAREEPAAFAEALLAELRAAPGVEDASIGCGLPLAYQCWTGAALAAAGTQFPEGERPWVGLHPIEDHWFSTLGVPLLAGRIFDSSDQADSPPVTVISRSAAERLFPDGDALGSPLWVTAEVTPEDGAGATVIGIVGDVLFGTPDAGVIPDVYLSHRQEESSGTLVLRTRGEALEILPQVRAAIERVGPGFPIYDVRTLTDIESAATADTRVLGGLLSVFALLALVLAAVGVWAVVAYAVSRRTRELGLRMALGAPSASVIRLVVWQGGLPVLVGLAVGAGGSYFASRMLRSVLFEVGPADPVTFAVGAVLLGFVGIMAAVIPAQRATRVDPMEALRAD